MSKKFKDTHYGDWTDWTASENIDVRNKGLTSLEGAPKEIKGHFMLSNNKLTSLEGGPIIVSGDYLANAMKTLVSLKGAPEVCKNFSVVDDSNLKSLEHCPKLIHERLNLQYTGFKSKEDIIAQLLKYKIIVKKLVLTDWGHFGFDENTAKNYKIGKFKDFLDL